jgi:uncharacterized membrane protein
MKNTSTARLEAFSDGVLAIIITISVLNLHAPVGDSIASLLPLVPLFLVYIVSFQTIATYWNNHHHLLKNAKELTSSIMWANIHLLFWLSLIPFAMEWLGNNIGKIWPTATFSFILLMSALAYYLLSRAILITQGKNSVLAKALGKDVKGKISLLGDFLAVVFAFSVPLISYIVIVAVSMMWFIPDKRLE